MPKQITILPNQSLTDICLQEFGTPEALFAILAVNPGFTVNTTLRGGQKIFIPDSYTAPTAAAAVVVNYYKANNINPATKPHYRVRITTAGDVRKTTGGNIRIV